MVEHPMQRKTMLIAAMTVTAALAGFVVAGTALAAEWHEYQGRLSAGQAYLVPVPAGADSLSFVLTPTGDAEAVAQIVVFDPRDARVGHFGLDASTSAADIVDPLAGNYVVYVYEVRDGTLSARLQSSDVSDLALLKAGTQRLDRPVLKDHEGGAVAKDLVVTLKEESVFVTLLYQGTVENLNAIVASPEGTVLTIAGESGVSYAPGLGVGSAPAREVDLTKIVSGAYNVHVEADDLEGTLFLTTLTYERPARLEPVEPITVGAAPSAPDANVVVPDGAPLKSGVPTAVQVAGSEIALALPSVFDPCAEAAAADEEGNETHDEKHGRHKKAHDAEGCREAESERDHGWFPWWDYSYRYEYEMALVAVYDPADELVGVFHLSTDDEPIVLLEGLAPGEYVLFAHGSSSRASDDDAPVALAVDPADPAAAIPHRDIALVTSEMSLGRESALLSYERVVELEFATPPLAIGAWGTHDTIATDYHAVIEGPEGVVWEDDALLRGPFFGHGWYGHFDRDLLVKGAYEFHAEALQYEGETTIGWVTYDRAFAFGDEPKIAEEDEAEEDEGDAPAAPADSPLARLLDLVPGL